MSDMVMFALIGVLVMLAYMNWKIDRLTRRVEDLILIQARNAAPPDPPLTADALMARAEEARRRSSIPRA